MKNNTNQMPEKDNGEKNPLYNWFKKQREKDTELSKEQVDKLNSIGNDFYIE